LALSILGSHSFLITAGDLHAFDSLPLSLFYSSLVPMFLALSGFLIIGSALCLDLSQFIMNRAMRIAPALAVDIFVSALVIGPLFTDLRARQALSDGFPELLAWPHLVASATMASAVAMASWHGVEKPILTFRRRFTFTARNVDPPAPRPGPAPIAIGSDMPKREERLDQRPRSTHH
jgi:peptidoglycan/LPS O-acetylase OafA/YrhL